MYKPQITKFKESSTSKKSVSDYWGALKSIVNNIVDRGVGQGTGGIFSVPPEILAYLAKVNLGADDFIMTRIPQVVSIGGARRNGSLPVDFYQDAQMLGDFLKAIGDYSIIRNSAAPLMLNCGSANGLTIADNVTFSGSPTGFMLVRCICANTVVGGQPRITITHNQTGNLYDFDVPKDGNYHYILIPLMSQTLIGAVTPTIGTFVDSTGVTTGAGLVFGGTVDTSSATQRLVVNPSFNIRASGFINTAMYTMPVYAPDFKAFYALYLLLHSQEVKNDMGWSDVPEIMYQALANTAINMANTGISKATEAMLG